jgi:hypothetical protein
LIKYLIDFFNYFSNFYANESFSSQLPFSLSLSIFFCIQLEMNLHLGVRFLVTGKGFTSGKSSGLRKELLLFIAVGRRVLSLWKFLHNSGMIGNWGTNKVWRLGGFLEDEVWSFGIGGFKATLLAIPSFLYKLATFTALEFSGHALTEDIVISFIINGMLKEKKFKRIGLWFIDLRI